MLIVENPNPFDTISQIILKYAFTYRHTISLCGFQYEKLIKIYGIL